MIIEDGDKKYLVDVYGRLAGSVGFHNPREPIPHLFEKLPECYYIAFRPSSAGAQAIHKIDRGNGVRQVWWAWGEWADRAELVYEPINGDGLDHVIGQDGALYPSDDFRVPRWDDIPDKPEYFPPTAHKHEQKDIVGLEEALAGKAPVSHTHKAADISDLSSLKIELTDEQKQQLKGDKGDTGPAGPAGPAGERGPAGEQGPEGPQGEPGTPGAAGSDGAPGEAGADGKDAKIGKVEAEAQVADNGTPSVEITTTAASEGENTTDFKFVFKIPKGEQGPAGQDGAAGPKGDNGETGPAGEAGPKGEDGKDGKDAPKHPLLFTCPESENGLHLEVEYCEANGTESTFKALIKTSDASNGKKDKVKGYTGNSWIAVPDGGFGSNFGGWPVMVDLTDVTEIDVSKLYYIRYRWVAKAANSGVAIASDLSEVSEVSEIPSDWYSMVYPCATEAPVSSSPSASLPAIADMKNDSVLFFTNGKYTALTIDELKTKINGSN